MSITHTFLDFIPSIFLGAPDDDTALSVLPGHKLLLRGMAYEAVRLTLIGSLFSLILTIALIPLLLKIIPWIYLNIKNYIGWILLAVVIYMIFKSGNPNKIFWSAFVFLLSGIFGLITLNLGLKDPLFPMFSGMFGISMLFMSIFEKVVIPTQRVTEMIKLKKKNIAKALGASVFSGTIVSIFPGLGPAQAAVVGSQLVGRIGIYSYLILVGGINTVSMLIALVTTFTINKARNGSIAVVQQMLGSTDLKYLAVFVAVALIAGGIATFLCLWLTKIFTTLINIINYQLLCVIIISLILSLVFYFSGFLGLLVLVVSTLIGLIPPLIPVPRTQMMGCLLLPVILYFIL
jgi:putative membrane protein